MSAIFDSWKSKYDQEIPQSQTADQSMEPPGRATGHLCSKTSEKQPALSSLPKTRKDVK